MPLNFISIKVSVGAPVNRWLMLAVFCCSTKRKTPPLISDFW